MMNKMITIAREITIYMTRSVSVGVDMSPPKFMVWVPEAKS
jgi:hypothetical protein